MAHAGHLAGDAGVEDKMNNKIIYGIILLTIILVSGCTTSNPTQKGNPTGNIISNDAFIKIPISEISETAKHYSFDVNGKEVKYFLDSFLNAWIGASIPLQSVTFLNILII